MKKHQSNTKNQDKDTKTHKQRNLQNKKELTANLRLPQISAGLRKNRDVRTVCMQMVRWYGKEKK